MRYVPPSDAYARATLLGIDALIVKGDAILGVQNGVEPQRVIRVQLTPALDRATRALIDRVRNEPWPALARELCADGVAARSADPPVVTKSGWNDFETNKVNPPPHTAHVVTINAP